MTYLLLYDRETIRFYDMEHDFVQQFIDGEAVCFYEMTKAKDSLGKIITELAEEFNLEAVKADNGEMVYPEIKLVLLKNEDDGINKVITGALQEYVIGSYELGDAIKAFFAEVKETDADALDLEYGINYNGLNYKQENGKLQRGEYSLLAYNIAADMIARALPKLGDYNNGK